VLTAVLSVAITFEEVDISVSFGEISATATFSMKEVRLPVRFVELSRLHVLLTNFKLFAIFDIFFVSNASLFFVISEVLNFVVPSNPPHSLISLVLGLWEVLEVAAMCLRIFSSSFLWCISTSAVSHIICDRGRFYIIPPLYLFTHHYFLCEWWRPLESFTDLTLFRYLDASLFLRFSRWLALTLSGALVTFLLARYQQ
jgi:hypothetical protein